jgi:MFS transporter, UMF1 family
METNYDKPTTEIVKNDKRITTAWAFFDWANSAYALVITVAIFPAYFLAKTDDIVTFFGYPVADSTIYAWSISLAYLIIALISPILSGIADFGGTRKKFLAFFTTLGALACISLVFFRGMDTLWVGIVGFIVATIGFAGGIVFYNSFLPQIATEDQYDAVSAKGFSYGFIGSVILLITNLIVIQNYSAFGFAESGDAVPVAFVMVGLWWIGFAQIPLRRLPADNTNAVSDPNMIARGYQELAKTWKNVRKNPNISRYLMTFFAFNAGVQAVLFLASTFAEKELHFETSQLIYLILILQILAIVGATIFAKVSAKIGNKNILLILLCVWAVICVVGYFVQTGMDFYFLASAVGLVMGGTQSLSRSTYAKFLPENTKDTASYFSFYDVMDKLSTVAGTLVFGIVDQLTGGMRNSVMALSVFFVVSIFLLYSIKVKSLRTSTD